MAKKKVLITGGSGFLGQYINLALKKDFNILTTFRLNPGNCMDFQSALIDISNTVSLKKIFADFKPEILVHTAAYSTPDICNKTEKSEVLNFNVNLIKELTGLCNNYQTKLVFTSTDLVYKTSDSLIKEDGKLEPKSFYAETKLLGEEIIQKNSGDYIILRTSLLYGIGLNHTRTHFQNMLESLERKENVNLFYNQFRTPLEANNGAQILAELFKKEIKNEVINFGGDEKISRLEMGKMVCNIFGFDKKNLVGVDGNELLGSIFVPDVSMNTGKLQSYGIKQKSISEILAEIKKARLEN
ncbi:MAG: sugar nucleotide-binding protein [Ignavibacteria bacterium]|nr:sugar nucleotide-binding protein [Ignavibacteria bacterium]